MKTEQQKTNIKEIKNPEFLKNLSYQELDILSHDIRDYLLYVTSKNGGHIASNLGVVETTISLCKTFDFTKDKIIFDVGHQSYTYKVLTGRNLESLRQKDGISGFQKMAESPYDHFEAGHSSTSISVAHGMAVARDLRGENYNIIAFIGDSSVSNGLSFEGLNNIAGSKHKVIIVLNDNNMSISKSVGAVSSIFRKFSTSAVYQKSKNFLFNNLVKNRFGRFLLRKFTSIKNWFKRKLLNTTIFDNLGYSVIGPVDGHYIKQLDKAFEKAKRINKSVVVYVKTIKGKGYPYAENDQEGNWHGVGKFDINTGEFNKKSNCISWSQQYESILNNEMINNDKIITLCAATGHGSYIDCLSKSLANRVIDVGISEEHAFTMAGGLSASGYHPVISIYSTFMQRAYDEISHDLARMNLNATILIDRAGLVGNDGETHQGVYDEAFLYSIPNVTITMASDSSESLSLLKESLNNHGVFAIRYPRENLLTVDNGIAQIPYGTWIKEKSGKDIAIVSVGPVTKEIKTILEEKSLSVTLYNAIYVRPMDEKAVEELLKYKKIIIYNPYATAEGFANSLEAKLLESSYKGSIIKRTVPTAFIKQATIEQQRESFGLLPYQIIDLIKD